MVYILFCLSFLLKTGLFAGFFLPGDSLLFLAGIYSRDLIENVIHIPGDFINVFLLSFLVAVMEF